MDNLMSFSYLKQKTCKLHAVEKKKSEICHGWILSFHFFLSLSSAQWVRGKQSGVIYTLKYKKQKCSLQFEV